MKKNRPSLGAVLGSKTPAPEMSRPIHARAPGRRKAGCEQLNVLVPVDIKIQAKIRAIKDGRDLSEIVTDLLSRWLEE
jgi:hypothetical protein